MFRKIVFNSYILLVFLMLSCSPMVGPNYTKPEADIEQTWMQNNDIITTEDYIN